MRAERSTLSIGFTLAFTRQSMMVASNFICVVGMEEGERTKKGGGRREDKGGRREAGGGRRK